jgi:hypothetical protein
MPDMFDKAWKGPEQGHSEGDIDYLFRRMAWLEGKVRDLEELVHFVGNGLENHTGSSSHSQGSIGVGTAMADFNRFFMVPWFAETEGVIQSIEQYQREAFHKCLREWLEELPHEISETKLWEFIFRKSLYYSNNLEEYVEFCLTRSILERRMDMRPDDRKPLTDHLAHVKKISIFSIKKAKGGREVIPRQMDGMEHRFGLPPASKSFQHLLWDLLLHKPNGERVTHYAREDGVSYNLREVLG